MSIQKFESLVDKMIHQAKMPQWNLAKDIGNILKIIYSELHSMKEEIKKLQNKECQKCAQRKSDTINTDTNDESNERLRELAFRRGQADARSGHRPVALGGAYLEGYLEAGDIREEGMGA
jgi:hypothetical protein